MHGLFTKPSIMACQPAVDIHLFILMALDAKSHFKSLAQKPVHGLDTAVARPAFNLFFNMPLVVEYDMLWNIKYFFPGYGHARIIIIVLFLDPGMTGDDVIVTVKTFFHRRNPRVDGPADIRMTKFAGNGFDSGMHPMAERDRLARARM